MAVQIRALEEMSKDSLLALNNAHEAETSRLDGDRLRMLISIRRSMYFRFWSNGPHKAARRRVSLGSSVMLSVMDATVGEESANMLGCVQAVSLD